MSVEKITSKIISDAEEHAKVTLDEAKVKCDAILAEASRQAEAVLEDAKQQGIEEKEKTIARKKAVADIDGRKMVLEAKQNLISACFEKAVDKLSSMEPKAYIEFLAGLVAKTGITEGELILNEKDKSAVGRDLTDYISKNLKDSKITLSEETRNIRGGFLLKQGSVYMNGTIEALVEEAKEELIGEVAGVLFR